MLIQQELNRRGIVVTDDELRSAAQFNPPPEFLTSPAFQTDGLFDIQKYQAYLASPTIDDLFFFQLEAYYRDVIPRSKLARQVSADLYIPDAALWDEYRFRNERISVRYVTLNPLQRVADSLVAVTLDEVREYYDSHEESYAIPAQVTVRAVVLNKTPIEQQVTPAAAGLGMERIEKPISPPSAHVRVDVVEHREFVAA